MLSEAFANNLSGHLGWYEHPLLGAFFVRKKNLAADSIIGGVAGVSPAGWVAENDEVGWGEGGAPP